MSALAKSAFDSSIVVVGIVKDISSTIHQDLKQFKSALSEFRNIKWFLVESNSTDDSVQVLEGLRQSEENFRFVTLPTSSKHESRIPGMSEGRNRYLEELQENQIYHDCDLVVVADFNALNDLIDKFSIATCFTREDWDICCANQNGPYYDVWALRHRLWSPNDCWQELSFLRNFIKYPEKALYAAVHSRMITIPRDSSWIKVESAFGGFAFYKRQLMIKSRYSPYDSDGNIVCEHVPFHLNLVNDGARIFINPGLINTKITDHSYERSLTRKLIRHLKYPIKFLGTSRVKRNSIPQSNDLDIL
jgi:glycosyltransferase involved in cell wall biosynthesis